MLGMRQHMITCQLGWCVSGTDAHSADQLAGPHVIASARNYLELMASNFLENLNVATA